MHDLHNAESESARRRRLDELFADQPFLSTTMRASLLHERDDRSPERVERVERLERTSDEPPAMMLPVLAEMSGDLDDVTLQLQTGREQRLHAITFDLDALLAPVEPRDEVEAEVPAAPLPSAHTRPRRLARRSTVPGASAAAPAAPEAGAPLRVELLLDNSVSPPRVIATSAEPMSASPDVMTVQEAAQFLRIGVSALRQRVRHEQLPHARIGRHVRFRREALIAWLAQRELTGA